MKFPKFSLPGSDGTTHTLADYLGKPFVVYFYPKDNTPGCTVQACAFRDQHKKLRALGVTVLGVSPDSIASHQRFIAKEELPFVLLCDADHKLAEKLGVWGEKQLYGRKFLGIIRTTFLVGADGTVAKEWRGVKVAGHVDTVLAAAKLAAE
ncbi:MAG: thioredoxin-dependent thiol peroxidase [Planctomycetes bacterium]|nr:thioredoxin-dependent thiol peroxidase [Planctomycetota bacterium]